MAGGASAPGFAARFRSAASGVRRALAARRLLDGALAGAPAGALLSAVLWALGEGHPVPAAAAGLLAGIAGGALVARRARFSDADVALYLDARLARDETVSTAFELESASGPGATKEVATAVVARAEAALSASAPRTLYPKVFQRRHAALPFLFAALAVPAFLPARMVPPGPIAEAPAPVRRDLPGLDRVEALRKLDALGAEDRRRLDALADAAKKLKEEAKAGVDRQEALDAVARLRDGIDAARDRLEDSKSRAGLSAAVRALERRPETASMARALGNADLVALDRETERLANSTEARSRAVARLALEDAEKAARERGAEDVARSLGEHRGLLKKRAAELAAMRELSRLLRGAASPEARRNLERLDRNSETTSDALAEALAEALEGLTEQERQRVAERLAKSMNGMQGAESMSPADIEKLAKALRSTAARDGLRDALKRLARGEGTTSARRARALALAHVGVEEAASSLTDGASGGDPSRKGGADTPAESDGTASNEPGGASSKHEGETPALAGSALPARAAGRPTGLGIPIGFESATSPPSAAAGAPRTGAAALTIAGPREISAVEHSDVPKEYREQVGRYFAP